METVNLMAGDEFVILADSHTRLEYQGYPSTPDFQIRDAVQHRNKVIAELRAKISELEHELDLLMPYEQRKALAQIRDWAKMLNNMYGTYINDEFLKQLARRVVVNGSSDN